MKTIADYSIIIIAIKVSCSEQTSSFAANSFKLFYASALETVFSIRTDPTIFTWRTIAGINYQRQHF